MLFFFFFFCSWLCVPFLDGGYASCLEIPNVLFWFFITSAHSLRRDYWHQDSFFVLDAVTFQTYIDRFSLSYPRATPPKLNYYSLMNTHRLHGLARFPVTGFSTWRMNIPQAARQAVTRTAKPVMSPLADLVLLPCERAVTAHRPAHPGRGR